MAATPVISMPILPAYSLYGIACLVHFVPEQENEKPDYGIVTPLATFNPIKVAFHEFAAIAKDVSQKGLTFKQRFAYIFAPPGTSHDGSKQPIAVIKANYIAAHPDQAGTPGLPVAEQRSRP